MNLIGYSKGMGARKELDYGSIWKFDDAATAGVRWRG
jgi:hypothetical protein